MWVTIRFANDKTQHTQNSSNYDQLFVDFRRQKSLIAVGWFLLKMTTVDIETPTRQQQQMVALKDVVASNWNANKGHTVSRTDWMLSKLWQKKPLLENCSPQLKSCGSLRKF